MCEERDDAQRKASGDDRRFDLHELAICSHAIEFGMRRHPFEVISPNASLRRACDKDRLRRKPNGNAVTLIPVPRRYDRASTGLVQHVRVISQRRRNHPRCEDDCVTRCRAENLGCVARRAVVARLTEEVRLREDEVEHRKPGKTEPGTMRARRRQTRQRLSRRDRQEREGR